MRWTSASELTRLYQLPTASCVHDAVFEQTGMTERALNEAIGRAVFPLEMISVLQQALSELEQPLPERPRYASACSGLDFFSPMMDAAFGSEWEYVAASDTNGKIRDFLHFAYQARGLSRDRIQRDATERAACEDALPADIFTMGPPCGSWSRRRHEPSQEDQGKARERVDRMLDYVRTHKPLIAIIENVMAPEVVSAFTALLASIPGYRLVPVVSDAIAHGEMKRERHVWYMVRRGV